MLPARSLGGIAGALIGAADRAPPRRLFRHGDDRLRPGVLLHRLPLEHVTGGDDGLARLRAPAARFRLRHARHRCTTTTLSTTSCSSVFAHRRRADGVAAALAVRPHPDRHSRERAPRALSRHSGRAAHLAVVRRSRASSSALPARSTRCSTISPIRARCTTACRAISSSWRCWAACARSGGRCSAPAMFVVLQDYISSDHRQLDVVHRHVVRAGRAVLPARRARACCAAGRRHEHCSRSRASPSTSAAWSPCSDVSMTVEPASCAR